MTIKPTSSSDITRLQAAITDMDCLAQSGFSEISAIAKLALAALETPDSYTNLEIIAQALRAIWVKADDIENCVNFAAEQVGCNYKDQFYDLRALAMSASAMTLTIDDEGSDELNAIRRVLSCLADKALEFANEIDRYEVRRMNDIYKAARQEVAA